MRCFAIVRYASARSFFSRSCARCKTAVVALLLGLGATVLAQGQGGLAGNVTDASAAAIPAARITVMRTSGETLREGTTGSDGRYTLSALSEGRVVVTISAPGFDTVRRDVTIRSGETLTLSVVLTIARLREGVSVVGVAPIATDSQTATKGDAPLLETPVSVSVIASQQITAQGATTVPQALRYATAVFSESRGAMTALDYMYSRGFLVNQFQDGLRQLSGGYSIPQLDTYLLDRVEVLRGPSSVLYGQADPGGVVNLITKRPTTTAVREATIQVGSHDRFQANVDFGGEIKEGGTLSYRFVGTGHAGNTQVDHAKDQRIALAPSLRWHPDDRTDLTIGGTFQHDPAVGFYNWIPAYGSVLPNPAVPGAQVPTSLDAGEPSFDDYARTVGSIDLTFTRKLNGVWSVRENVRSGHVSSTFDKIYSSFLEDDYRTLSRYAWHLSDGLNMLAFDSQALASLVTGRLTHSLLGGVDYQRGWYHQDLGYNFASGPGPDEVPTLDIFAPVYNRTIATPPYDSLSAQTQDQTGLYIQDRMVAGRWRFLVGGREDWTGDVARDRATNDSESHSDHAFTGRAGVVYVTPNHWAPYFSASQSFQPTVGSDFEGNVFKPTTGQQFEGGIKFESGDARMSATGALYQLTQQNVVSPDPVHPRQSLQTGEIRSRGFELSTQIAAARGLSILASYSHVAQLVTEGGVSFGPSEGKVPSGLPQDQASVWGQFALAQRALAGANIALGMRFLGSSWGDDSNSFEVPSATVADAAATYVFGQSQNAGPAWRVQLNVSNLFDKTYVASCGGDSYCAYGLRRSVLTSLSRAW